MRTGQIPLKNPFDLSNLSILPQNQGLQGQ
jgi:hypothetical protein